MINDYDIPMPRWELSDPFGRNAIKGFRYDLKRAMCERDSYREQLETVLDGQGKAVQMLANSLAHEQEVSRELDRRLRVCDEARKSLGEKLTRANDSAESMTNRLAKLRVDYDKLKEEYDELVEQHELLVRGMTDKEEA